MGIDRRVAFGIGYRVEASDAINEAELEDGFDEYLWNEVGDDFDSFKVGDDYTDGDTEMYLVISDPFKYGFDLTKVKKALDKEVKRLSLCTKGEFGTVGGMYTY